ncbi:hypothetical protein ACQR36_29845 [Rhodococcus erythropolis]|uniref:hypothetical protein n=1 Tax=Rhodococcus erythropolis TaxID=1833 RepID=UPI003D14878F
MSKFKLVMCGVALIVVSGLSGFIVSRITRASWNMDSWGAVQWGPVAAWFSGVLTAIAVAVSLWQANEAKKKSIKDAKRASKLLKREKKRNKDAEKAETKRHEQALSHADQQVQRELDAQRRHQQLMAIPPLWDAIAELQEPTKIMLRALQNGATAGIDVRTDSDERYSQWTTAYNKAEVSLTLPSLIIYDEETVDRLNDTFRALMSLKNEVFKLHHKYNKHNEISVKEVMDVHEKMKEVIDGRGPMVETASRKIGGVLDYMIKRK